MTPRPTINDVMDCLVTDAKIPRDGGLALSVPMSRLDLADDLAVKFLGVPAAHNRVFDVLLMRGPDKVARGIVGLVEILVMHVRQVVWIGHEGLSDKSREIEGFLFALLAQHQMGVASLVKGSGQQASAPEHDAASAFVGNKPIKTADSPKVGDFVQSFVSGDGLPLFTKHFSPPSVAHEYSVCHMMVQGQGVT